MAVPAPDSGVLKRIYANLVGPGGLISLDIPDRILERLYTYGSLKDTDDGAQFEIKNRLQDAKVTGVSRVFVDGERVPLEDIRLVTADGKVYELDSVDEDNYVNFPVGRTVIVQVDGVTVTKGKHNIEIDFEDARNARDFRDWVFENFDIIKKRAEETTSTGQLARIEDYLTNNHAHFRFDYTTGDAAGQNVVGKATFAACNWILSEETMLHHLYVEPSSIHHHAQVATLGSFFPGANTNGAHPANGLASLFIATGQDEANVAESSAAMVNTTLLNDNSLHVSVTIPSLIVATYGGGTNLPTQRECPEMLDCAGGGNVMKFAEIAAATVLAGELSLASVISASDWVTGHDELGRNR